MADWGDLDEPAGVTDIEAVRMTAAREIAGLPLGCRLEVSIPTGRLVSIGMLKTATFTKDEWTALVVLHEDGKVCRERLGWWLEQKAASKGSYKIWMDRGPRGALDPEVDYARAQLRGTFPTTVGEVLDAWGWDLKRVATEL